MYYCTFKVRPMTLEVVKSQQVKCLSKNCTLDESSENQMDLVKLVVSTTVTDAANCGNIQTTRRRGFSCKVGLNWKTGKNNSVK